MSLLMVPIRADALFLSMPQSVVEAMANFNRLPYVKNDNGKLYDANFDMAYVSETLIPPPFNNHNLVLKPGVHLHWSLPDTLCQPVKTPVVYKNLLRQFLIANSQTINSVNVNSIFPNLWNELLSQKWIEQPYASDLKAKISEEQRGALTSITNEADLKLLGNYFETLSGTFCPVPDRWLITRQGWGAEKQWVVESDYLSSVINQGVTVPLPVDPHLGGQPFRYMGRAVELDQYNMGETKERWADHWYQPLTAVGYGEPTFAAFYPDCHSVFGFYDSNIETENQLEGLSYTVIGWYSQPEYDYYNTLAADPTMSQDDKIVIIKDEMNWEGASTPLPLQMACYSRVMPVTGTTASSVTVAIGNTGTEALAAWLAGQSLPATLDEKNLNAILQADTLQRQADQGYEFQEACHDKGFTAVSSGKVWEIRWVSDGMVNEELPPALPDELAVALNELNLRQQQYEQASDVIESLREGLFFDWYKYMISVYPPEGSRYIYPKPDRVMRFIQENDLEPLKDEITILSEYSNGLTRQLAAIQGMIEVENNKPSVKKSLKTWKLLPVPAPRFWQPTEPVVMVIDPTLQHCDEEDFDCQAETLDYPITKEQLGTIWACVKVKTPKSSRPWNPKMLEWEVEFFPFDQIKGLNGGYLPECITSMFELDNGSPELRCLGAEHTKGISLYSGRSILTAAARNGFKKAIEKCGDRLGQREIDSLNALLDANYFLSQSLGGFNRALLMQNQTLQLPVADPMGFRDYQEFALKMQMGVDNANKTAPHPLNDFIPLRAGRMLVHNLRLVDTFGQIKKVSTQSLILSQALQDVSEPNMVYLPPRLVQPARINFRWLAAEPHKLQSGSQTENDETEMNTHPASTPVCGWVLPNLLDDSLAFYNSEGKALGTLTGDAVQPWRPAYGSDDTVSRPEDIPNQFLRKVACFLKQQIIQNDGYLDQYINVLEQSLADIEPEWFAKNQAMALLIGRPLAVVRASLDLQLQGLAAIDLSWDALRLDMAGRERDTYGITGVKFPIRLGEQGKLHDGLVGYWREQDGRLSKDFYTPFGTLDDSLATTKRSEPITQTIGAEAQKVTMLIDPRGTVHATSGILPVKEIGIPHEQYWNALRGIEVSFLSAPLLLEAHCTNIPVPEEPGYQWQWVTCQTPESWQADALSPVAKPVALPGSQEVREGWLRLRYTENSNQ